VKELKEAGVKVAVCGQSLRGRGIENEQLLSEVEVATSMLTTVTSYQMKGYQLLKF
jgi:intracellular sulfur oxidation DsrE/DsrF family protein